MPARVYGGSAAYPAPSPRPILIIGNLDGVHLGHRALVTKARARAEAIGVPCCAYTFDPAPREVLGRDAGAPRIQTLSDRIALLHELGVDEVVVEPFDRAFADHEPRWFATEVLGARLAVSGVVVGWDFRFGRARSGTVADLVAWLDVEVTPVDPVMRGGDTISSSRIRRLVRDGAVGEAAALLGRPHEVVGQVVRGAQRGRGMGFPTANVQTDTELLPPHGVYAVRLRVDGAVHAGVANLGTRPTFGGGAPVLEVHLLGFEGDLYDREVRVELVERIRGEQTFPNADALAARIRADADAARALLGS